MEEEGEEEEEEEGEEGVEVAPGSVGEDLHHQDPLHTQDPPHHQGHIHHRGPLHLGQKATAQETIIITTSPTTVYPTGEEEPLTMITGNKYLFGSDKSPRSDYQCDYDYVCLSVCLTLMRIFKAGIINGVY